MADIFLSYEKSDADHARELADALAKKGWSVWWDHKIPPGRTWADYIEQELERSRCVITLWSAASVNSRWVALETRKAMELGVLVPVRIEPVEVPFEFGDVQCADLIEWQARGPSQEGFESLVQAISDRAPLPVAPPAATPAAPPARPAPDREPPQPTRPGREPGPGSGGFADVAGPPGARGWKRVLQGRAWLWSLPVLILALVAFVVLRSGPRPQQDNQEPDSTAVTSGPENSGLTSSGPETSSTSSGDAPPPESVVPRPARIVRFEARPPAITEGESVKLVWQTANAERVELRPGGPVPSTGSMVVTPGQGTEYLLLALGPRGVVERSVRVTVQPRVDPGTHPGDLARPSTTVRIEVVTGAAGSNDPLELRLTGDVPGSASIRQLPTRPGHLVPGARTGYNVRVPLDFCAIRGFGLFKPGPDDWELREVWVYVDDQLMYFDQVANRVFRTASDSYQGGWAGTQKYKERCP